MQFIDGKFVLTYQQPPEISELVDKYSDLVLILKDSEEDNNPIEYPVNRFTFMLYAGGLKPMVEEYYEDKLPIIFYDKYIFKYYLNLIYNKDNSEIIKNHPDYILNLKILELVDYLMLNFNAETAFYSIYIPDDTEALNSYISTLKLYKNLNFYKFLSLKLTINSPLNNFSRFEKQQLIEYLNIPMFLYMRENKVYLEMLQDKPFVLTSDVDGLMEVNADIIGKYFILTYFKNGKYYHNVYLTNGYLERTLEFPYEEIKAISPKSNYIVTRNYLYSLKEDKIELDFRIITLNVSYAKVSFDENYLFIKSYKCILIDINQHLQIREWTINKEDGDFLSAYFTINNEELILAFSYKIIYYNIKTNSQREEKFTTQLYDVAYSVYKKLALVTENKIIIRDYYYPSIKQEYDLQPDKVRFTYNKNYIVLIKENIVSILDLVSRVIVKYYLKNYFTEISRIKIKENIMRS
ncbi:MAG: hypothetical protein QW478_01180 [Candidatus Micrarchaeaceae archaeon]